MSAAAGRGDAKAQLHRGPRGKKLRKRKSSSSARAPAGEAAPARRPPTRPALGARRTTRHSTLQTAPEVQLRSARDPAPIPTKFREKLPPERGLFRTTGGQRRQQGRASPSQAHSAPPRPGPRSARLRDGEGSSLPYLRHICRPDGSHLRGGRGWVTARTRMWDSATGLPAPLPPPRSRRHGLRGNAQEPPERAHHTPLRPLAATPPSWAGGKGRRERARARAARPRRTEGRGQGGCGGGGPPARAPPRTAPRALQPGGDSRNDPSPGRLRAAPGIHTAGAGGVAVPTEACFGSAFAGKRTWLWCDSRKECALTQLSLDKHIPLSGDAPWARQNSVSHNFSERGRD